MGTGGAPRRADISYHFSLADPLARFQPRSEFGQMKIGCGINRIVPDAHNISSSSLILAACHDTVADGHDGSTLGSGIIHAGMWLDPTRDRMLARIRKTGAYTGIFQRGLQESLSHALPLVVPPEIPPVLLVEHYHRKLFTGMAENGIAHSIHRKDLTVTDTLIIKHAETVTFLQTEEIHGPCGSG